MIKKVPNDNKEADPLSEPISNEIENDEYIEEPFEAE